MKLLYGILLMPMTLVCQKIVAIQCNESLQLGIGKGHHQFNFTEKGQSKSLNELEFNSYVFHIPGEYQIEVVDKKEKDEREHDCLHVQLPSKISLIVDSIQIHFLENSIRTSHPIRRNQSTDGIELFIDVDVVNYLGERVQMNQGLVQTAGIGTSISASLDSDFYQLKEGKHTFVYHLKGLCSETSYIQFDFLTPNGSIIPIALKNPVAN